MFDFYPTRRGRGGEGEESVARGRHGGSWAVSFPAGRARR